MSRDTQDNLLLLLGALLLHLGLTDLHLRYVKPEMQPLILVTGAGLLTVGLLGLARLYRTLAAGKDGSPAGAHSHGGPRAAWLLLLPLLVMANVSPPSLGAYAAARGNATVAAPTFELPPLPAPRDGAVDLTPLDYSTRALYADQPLRGQVVRLSGFVTPGDGDWFVTRMALSCCAADGRPVKVLTTGAAALAAPPADTWVEVTGRYTARQVPQGSSLPVPTIDVLDVRAAPRPQNDYEP